MNSKNIKKHLTNVVRNWMNEIDNEKVKGAIRENTMITGGALISLLTGEPVNDYDVYFRTEEACVTVASYYVDIWNKEHPDRIVELRLEKDTGKVKCFVRSRGIAEENNEIKEGMNSSEENEIGRPIRITSNAITLSNKIQIVTRFFGEVEEIHRNFDFAHCTCAWSSWDNEVFLPQKALECIINKELFYVGSLYPLCSIIRTKKYIERGYSINAGQYVKMAMQLNELDLKNIEVLEDQLTGVDTSYFQMLIEDLQSHMKEANSDKIDSNYAIELINKLF